MQLLFPSFSTNSILFLTEVAVGALTRLETPWTDHQLQLNSNYFNDHAYVAFIWEERWSSQFVPFHIEYYSIIPVGSQYSHVSLPIRVFSK